MRRESIEELQVRMAQAETLAPEGHFIRHVKSGGIYMIRGHSLRESDLEALVEYSPQHGPVVLFSRPLSEVRARFVLVNGEQWPLLPETETTNP